MYSLKFNEIFSSGIIPLKGAANFNWIFSNIGAELINKEGFIPQEITSPQFLTTCGGQQPRGGM